MSVFKKLLRPVLQYRKRKTKPILPPWEAMQALRTMTKKSAQETVMLNLHQFTTKETVQQLRFDNNHGAVVAILEEAITPKKSLRSSSSTGHAERLAAAKLQIANLAEVNENFAQDHFAATDYSVRKHLMPNFWHFAFIETPFNREKYTSETQEYVVLALLNAVRKHLGAQKYLDTMHILQTLFLQNVNTLKLRDSSSPGGTRDIRSDDRAYYDMLLVHHIHVLHSMLHTSSMFPNFYGRFDARGSIVTYLDTFVQMLDDAPSYNSVVNIWHRAHEDNVVDGLNFHETNDPHGVSHIPDLKNYAGEV